ncbi:MAG: hypothetical protein RBR35_04545 [Salinivirgaceae bacterium]|nr:hypothetical protein [Salinivirgaceae bacterium]MDY0279812.1 hypothetical protein [Salinivirgaceae bacterium]
MKHTKLNTNWNADPNNPEPTISLIENGIELSFLLDSTAFEHIDKEDMGSLEFQNVFAYRLESTNNEDSSSNQFRFKNDQLPRGAFYELVNSKWDSNFPNDKIVVNESINKKEIRHFVFFLGNTIFECLATDYQFNYKNNLIEILDEKYPKGYLNHYISMFTSQFSKPTIDNFKIYTDLYIQMESKKEFIDLKNELKNIKKNNDLSLYLKFANRFEIIGFGIKQLNDMIKVIENHNI